MWVVDVLLKFGSKGFSKYLINERIEWRRWVLGGKGEGGGLGLGVHVEDERFRLGEGALGRIIAGFVGVSFV